MTAVLRVRSTFSTMLAIGLVACGGPAEGEPGTEDPGAADPAAGPTPKAARSIQLNGRPATPGDLAILARFEASWGTEIPSGAYWYDKTSGAAGLWGGPVRGFLGAGLDLGGALPANASGGGQGTLTGVFINGREIHPLDQQGLTQWLGQPPPAGRWWVDGQGNFGPEGYGAAGNLFQIAQSRGRGGNGSYYRSDLQSGSSVFVGDGCTSVSGRLSPSDSSSSYSYFVGC